MKIININKIVFFVGIMALSTSLCLGSTFDEACGDGNMNNPNCTHWGTIEGGHMLYAFEDSFTGLIYEEANVTGTWLMRGNGSLDINVSFHAEYPVYLFGNGEKMERMDFTINQQNVSSYLWDVIALPLWSVPISGTILYDLESTDPTPRPLPSSSAEINLGNGGTFVFSLPSFDSAPGLNYATTGNRVQTGFLYGDMDGNCSIGTGDMTYIAAHDGDSGFWVKGDLNDDGVVSYRDLFVLWSNWGDSCPF